MDEELARLRASLSEILARDPGVHLAVLFGSAARGTLSPDSDLDIGIVPTDPDVPLAWELALAEQLVAACGRPVDLVRLDRATPLVRWEVARVAKPLHVASPSVFSGFIAQAALDHADIAPLMERTAKAYRKRLAAGLPR